MAAAFTPGVQYLLDARCVHRVGSLRIGEMAVWVGVTAAHRGAAFAACRYVIDEVKHRLPIWKKETYADGDSGWINCQHCHNHTQTISEDDSAGNWRARAENPKKQ